MDEMNRYTFIAWNKYTEEERTQMAVDGIPIQKALAMYTRIKLLYRRQYSIEKLMVCCWYRCQCSILYSVECMSMDVIAHIWSSSSSLSSSQQIVYNCTYNSKTFCVNQLQNRFLWKSIQALEFQRQTNAIEIQLKTAATTNNHQIYVWNFCAEMRFCLYN